MTNFSSKKFLATKNFSVTFVRNLAPKKKKKKKGKQKQNKKS